MQPSLDVCPACGQQSESDTFCSRCGSSLLVDLLLSGWAGDERARYLAAKELAALGLPGQDLASLRRALGGPPGGVLVVRLPRNTARRALEILARHGGLGSVRPARARPFPWKTSAAGAALLVFLLGIGWWAWPSAAPGPRAEGDAPAAARPDATAPVTPPAEAPAAEERPPEEDSEATEPPALGTAEIADRVSGSVAEATCRDHLGTAFFVAPGRAVTNAHVACGLGEEVRLRVRGGQTLAGRTVVWEEGPDFAVIDAPDAEAPPLPLGDSTSLAIGQPVVFVGNPSGLEATVHEGRISFVGRNLLGTAYLQLNGDVNPGNSGGPVLDQQARVVGIVTLKVLGADGIGLALPIEYLRPHLELGPGSEASGARWRDLLDRVRQDDAREVEAYRSLYERPTVVHALARGPDRVRVVVLARFEEEPGRESLRVEFRGADQALCIAEGTVERWGRVQDALAETRDQTLDRARLAWAIEHRVAEDLYAGSLNLRVDHCSKETLAQDAILVIEGGAPSDVPVHCPRWNEPRSPGRSLPVRPPRRR